MSSTRPYVTNCPRPMPSPNGTNREGLTLPSDHVSMAQDAALHAYDVVDGIAADGNSNPVLKRHRERQELLKRFPNWERMEAWRR